MMETGDDASRTHMVEMPECMTFQYYIVNAFGFALQLVPVMFVVLRPFGGRCYRVPRWALWIALAVYGAAVSLAFPLVVCNVRVVDTALLGNLYLLAAALVFAAAYSYVVDAPPARKFLSFVFGVVYAAVQHSVVNLLLPLVSPPEAYAASDPYSPWGTALFAITTAVTLPLAVLFQEKALRRYLEVIDVRQTRRDMLAMVAASAVYLCLMVSFTSFYQMQNAGIAWMAAPVGLLFTVLFGLFLYYCYHLALVREQELANRIHTEVFVESARMLQKEIERARDVRHDLRHLLRELGALSDEQATPEIRRCIGRIERLTRHADAVFCDNRALNALLRYYARFADEGGIPIHVAVACGALDVDEADLVLAVGNVLDNALTAAGEYYEGGLQTRCALETVNADGTELNETADITWTKDADGKPLSYTVVLKNDGAYAATTTGDVKTDESGLISWVGDSMRLIIASMQEWGLGYQEKVRGE